MYICIYVYMYICIYVKLYIYIGSVQNPCWLKSNLEGDSTTQFRRIGIFQEGNPYYPTSTMK